LTAKYRGVPLGYIAALEQRLLTTEIALLEALSSIQENSECSLSVSEKTCLKAQDEGRSKDARMEEWNKHPLEHDGDKEAWRNAKIQHLREKEDHKVVERRSSIIDDLQQDPAWLELSSTTQAQSASTAEVFEEYDSMAVARDPASLGDGVSPRNILPTNEVVRDMLHFQHNIQHRQPHEVSGHSVDAAMPKIFTQASNMAVLDHGQRGEEEATALLRPARKRDRVSHSREWQNYF
jgi:hypothetical protein